MNRSAGWLERFRYLPLMLFLATGLPALVSCLATLAPIAADHAISFAQDLLSTASHNYSPEYADDLDQLLHDLIAVTSSPPDADSEGPPAATKIALDLAILVQRASAGGFSGPLPIEDGATLYSDPNDPAAGDKLKISFRVNCDCYVYVIAVDGTGFVVPVFPDFESVYPNPVRAHQLHIVPEADEWYGLDQYTGVEEIYFVASFARRAGLEQTIRRLAARKREVRAGYRPVREAAVIPHTRGLVKIKTGQSETVQAQSGKMHDYTPTTFLATTTDTDLVITRWFYHKQMAP